MQATSTVRLRSSLAVAAVLAVCLPHAGEAAKLQVMTFVFRGDADQGTTDDDAFVIHQYYLVALQETCTVTDYDPEQIWVFHAFQTGALKKDDLIRAGETVTPERVLRILEAVSAATNVRLDAATFGVYTKSDGVDAIRLTVIDRVTHLMYTETVDNSQGDLYGRAAVLVPKTIERMRAAAGGSGFEAVGSTATAAPGEQPPTVPDAPNTEPGAAPGPLLAPDEARRRAFEHLAQAEQLALAGDYEGAIAELTLAEQLNTPDIRVRFEIYNCRADYRYMREDLEGALRDLDSATQYATDEGKALLEGKRKRWVIGGSIDRATLREKEAWTVRKLRDWLRVHPDDKEARFALARQYMALQPEPEWGLALEQLEWLRVYLPREPTVLEALALCHLRLKQPAKAAEVLVRWREEIGASFTRSAALLLAEAREAQGDPAAALDDLAWVAGQSEEPVQLAEDEYLLLVKSVEHVLTQQVNKIVAVLQDAGTLLTHGEGSVGRARESIRADASAAGPALAKVAKVLTAVQPLESWTRWHDHVLLCTQFLRQCQAEALVALDATDQRAWQRAVEAFNMAKEEGLAAVDTRPATAPARRTPSEGEEVIGL